MLNNTKICIYIYIYVYIYIHKTLGRNLRIHLMILLVATSWKLLEGPPILNKNCICLGRRKVRSTRTTT